MIKIDYDVTIPETEEAFKAFWRKYNIQRTLMLSLVYAIAAFLFITIIAADATSLFGWIGLGAALGLLTSIWLKPNRARKKLIAALELMDEEKYSASFDENNIEIETVITARKSDGLEELNNSENTQNTKSPSDSEDTGDSENTEDSESRGENTQPAEKIEKTVIEIATQELYSLENNDVFLLFVNRSLIYVFPKRCMTEGQVTGLREYFREKRI